MSAIPEDLVPLSQVAQRLRVDSRTGIGSSDAVTRCGTEIARCEMFPSDGDTGAQRGHTRRVV